MPPTLAHQSFAALVAPAGWLQVSFACDHVPPAPVHIFCMSTRALPAHPASGTINPTASAIPTISFPRIIPPPRLTTASFERQPTKDGDDSPASVGSRRLSWARRANPLPNTTEPNHV